LKLNGVEKSFFLLDFCLLAPITEEIFFRGYIYRILRNKYNIVLGAVISTVIFVAFHGISVENLIQENIILALVSLIFTYVYEKTGSIMTGIITHALNNTLWFLFVYFGLRLQTN
jgi:membrane protease YdiL (CAAX protease family)